MLRICINGFFGPDPLRKGQYEQSIIIQVQKMSEEVKFIPYEAALEIVGNVIEEEHIHDMDRRILTVYDKTGKELCWYDAEEIMEESKPEGKSTSDQLKKAAVEHIMHLIPEWSVEHLMKKNND